MAMTAKEIRDYIRKVESDPNIRITAYDSADAKMAEIANRFLNKYFRTAKGKKSMKRLAMETLFPQGCLICGREWVNHTFYVYKQTKCPGIEWTPGAKWEVDPETGFVKIDV